MARMIYQRRGGPMIHWDRGAAPGSGRSAAARELGGLGSLGTDIAYATLPRAGGPEILTGDEAQSALDAATATIHSSAGRKAVAAAAAYHGYKRNNSLGMALVWAAAGYLAPVITPVISIAQGFGKPRGGA